MAIRSNPSLLNGALIGLGVFILMTTRPYEGMFFALPLGAALVLRFIRSTAPERRSLIPAGLMAAVLVAAGFGLTLAHNEAVTGDWKVVPDSLYRQAYGGSAPVLSDEPASTRWNAGPVRQNPIQSRRLSHFLQSPSDMGRNSVGGGFPNSELLELLRWICASHSVRSRSLRSQARADTSACSGFARPWSIARDLRFCPLRRARFWFCHSGDHGRI